MGKRTKRHIKAKLSPAKVPIPEKLVNLLRLANLVPVQFRNPAWAARESSGQQVQVDWFSKYEDEYIALNWKLETRGRAQKRDNVTKSRFPLELLAFVMHDNDMQIIEVDGDALPLVNSKSSIEDNFSVLGKEDAELHKIIQNAYERLFEVSRIQERIAKKYKPLDEIKIGNQTYFYMEAEYFWEQSRQRYYFVLAVQETLSCLTRTGEQNQALLSRIVSHLYEETIPRLCVIQDGQDSGKIALHQPTLYESLLSVEANRIRECPVCYKIFWAGRKDQVGCTPQCAKVIRTRRWRENATKYELARAEKERLAMTKSKPNPKKKGT